MLISTSLIKEVMSANAPLFACRSEKASIFIFNFPALCPFQLMFPYHFIDKAFPVVHETIFVIEPIGLEFFV